MSEPTKAKVKSIAQALLVIYCIVSAVLVLKIENDLQQVESDLQHTQDLLLTTREQINANSKLALMLAELREADRREEGKSIVPMFPKIEYD
jgi:hypothetical protein